MSSSLIVLIVQGVIEIIKLAVSMRKEDKCAVKEAICKVKDLNKKWKI